MEMLEFDGALELREIALAVGYQTLRRSRSHRHRCRTPLRRPEDCRERCVCHSAGGQQVA